MRLYVMYAECLGHAEHSVKSSYFLLFRHWGHINFTYQLLEE